MGGKMRIEFDSVMGKDKGSMVNRLVKRGLEKNEAISIVNIVMNAERYMQEEATAKAQLLVLKQVLIEGDRVLGATEDMGAYYREIKDRIKLLERRH